jgi:uncharacterized membrane protein
MKTILLFALTLALVLLLALDVDARGCGGRRGGRRHRGGSCTATAAPTYSNGTATMGGCSGGVCR